MKWGNFPASSKDQNKGQLKRSCFRYGKRKSISSGVLSGKWHQPGEYKGDEECNGVSIWIQQGFFLRWKLSDSFLVYFINYFCKLPLSLIALKDTKLEDSISFYLRISKKRNFKKRENHRAQMCINTCWNDKTVILRVGLACDTFQAITDYNVL